MKSKYISIIVLVTLVFSIALYVSVKIAPTEILSSTSPDGEYRLVISEKKKMISMPGDGGSKCVKIELYKGFWSIQKDCDNCPTFSNELSRNPRWDMDAMQVHYALARSVNLITGECEE
jgi:hypothetical protein